MKEEWIFYPDQGLSHPFRRQKTKNENMDTMDLTLGTSFKRLNALKYPNATSRVKMVSDDRN